MANNYRKERNKLVKEMQEAEAPRIRHKKIEEDTTQARKKALDLSSSINERLGTEQEELERVVNKKQEEKKSINVSRETSEDVTVSFVKPKKVKAKKGRQKKEKEKKFGEGIYGEKRKYTKEELSRLRSEVMKEYWRKRKEADGRIQAQEQQIEKEIFKDTIKKDYLESKGGQLTAEEEALFGSFDDLSEEQKNEIAPKFEIVEHIKEYLYTMENPSENKDTKITTDGLVRKLNGTFNQRKYSLRDRFIAHVDDVYNTHSFEEYIHHLEVHESSISELTEMVVYYYENTTDGEAHIMELMEILLEHPLTISEAKEYPNDEGGFLEIDDDYELPFE